MLYEFWVLLGFCRFLRGRALWGERGGVGAEFGFFVGFGLRGVLFLGGCVFLGGEGARRGWGLAFCFPRSFFTGVGGLVLVAGVGRWSWVGVGLVFLGTVCLLFVFWVGGRGWGFGWGGDLGLFLCLVLGLCLLLGGVALVWRGWGGGVGGFGFCWVCLVFFNFWFCLVIWGLVLLWVEPPLAKRGVCTMNR